MNEFSYAFPFWLTVPALSLAMRGYRRAAGLLLAGMPLLAAVLGAWDLPHAAAPAAVAGAAALLFFLARRSSYRLTHRTGVRTRGLRRELRAARSRVEDLSREARRRNAVLERLQSRFTLVQGMATRLDTAVLLQSLGTLWSDVPGVRRVLLVQRRPNGNWAVTFANNLPDPEEWVHLLEAYPALTQGKRLRKIPSLDRLPFLKGRGLEAPFFLVPVAWGDDVMALGYVEVTTELFEDGDAGFDTERKLVSIGLRRAYLYDLMSERSRHDGLTGTLLRRAFMERLHEAVRQSLRYKTPLFAAIFDIDRFKAINDAHGHPAGDRALVQVARIAGELAVPGVTLGRLGGDEFSLILELPSLEASMAWMETLRARIAASPLREGGQDVRMSISAGVSSFLPDKPDGETLLVKADEALYRAKHEGRDRVAAAPGGG